ncbi:MAG: Methyltransferase type 11 [Parachlamydiales bacterium]|nr:Methyltransferase type 11 [Parachlamydiales bacterium]
MNKEKLEAQYRTHHERGKRYGYLFCHGQRGPWLQNWIGTGKKVLDLGCRDGMLTRYFCRGNDVLGVDIDRKALEIARKNLGIETMWVDLNAEWPFPNESFDAIVACEILEHLYVLDSLMERLCASLRPGAIFIGSVPNAFRVRNRLKFLAGNEFESDPTHVRCFSHQNLTTMLSKQFSEVQIVPIQGKILPFLKVGPMMPAVLNRLFAKDLLWRAVR